MDIDMLDIFTERELHLMAATAEALCSSYFDSGTALYRWLNDGISDGGHIVAQQLSHDAGENPDTALRELREQKAVLCEYLMERIELNWNDELLRIVVDYREFILAAAREAKGKS